MQLQLCSITRIRLVGCLLGSMILTGLAAAQSIPLQAAPPIDPGTFHLTVTEREVSLEAQEASVAAIFAEIGQRTGIPMVIYPGVDERITIQLTRVALHEALKRLTNNVAILTARSTDAPLHRITKVYVFATGYTKPPQVDGSPIPPQAPVTGDTTRSQAETANRAVARPAPFQFTFDPSQHMKQSQ